MANPTRFDFHVVDFMNSEDVERMSAEEVGQYILLLCKSWLIGKEATLPDDFKYLASQARCRQVSDLVLKKFPIINTSEGPRRRNEVLFGEWLLAKDRQNSYSERGKKGNDTRYSENYSESNSEHGKVAQVKECNSPIPYHSNHTIPTNPNQTSSISFSGGSFGQGNFKTIRARWWSHFQKDLQKSKQNKEQYAQACNTFGEDKILNYLEIWATQNEWVSAHPKGGNRLYVFLQALPEMIEGDEIRVAREKEIEKKNGPEIPTAEVDQILKEASRQRDQEIQKELEKLEAQKKFDEQNRDLI